jgi:hypothetical protein
VLYSKFPEQRQYLFHAFAVCGVAHTRSPHGRREDMLCTVWGPESYYLLEVPCVVRIEDGLSCFLLGGEGRHLDWAK